MIYFNESDSEYDIVPMISVECGPWHTVFQSAVAPKLWITGNGRICPESLPLFDMMSVNLVRCGDFLTYVFASNNEVYEIND